MGLKHVGFIELPENRKKGGFDHAAVHLASQSLYVAHTANDAVDIIDLKRGKYAGSISDLQGAAGVLVSNEHGLVFTSNREEETIGVFRHESHDQLEKVKVGGRPNGLAYDHKTSLLLAANVSRPSSVGGVTVSIVNVKERLMVADVMVPGRTRWTVYDPKTEWFYVNIAQPAKIVKVNAKDPDGIVGEFNVPATGPHGLDLDVGRNLLYCACDEGGLYSVDVESGKASKLSDLMGPPDVIFYNPKLDHLYVAVGKPGVIEVFDTETLRKVQTVNTELEAHTIAFDSNTNRVYAFLPETHRASVYQDE